MDITDTLDKSIFNKALVNITFFFPVETRNDNNVEITYMYM